MSIYWIQTYSTNGFDFVDTKPEQISLIDIANSLAQIPRFNGHLKRPFSVSQHSLTVAAAMEKDGLDKDKCLQGLMHDAHEAYMGDLTKPFIDYLEDVHNIHMRKIAEPIKKAIGNRFGIDLINLPEEVEKYDLACLRTEAEALFERPKNNWTKHIEHK